MLQSREIRAIAPITPWTRAFGPSNTCSGDPGEVAEGEVNAHLGNSGLENAMSETESCRAVKRDGERCTNKPQIAGFCRVHYPKPEPGTQSRLREGLKTAGQVIAVAGGAVKLIEVIVQLWQSLPFGPGPKMPDDYEYLVGQVGPFYPEMPTSYEPFTKGPGTVDWRQARAVYDKSLAVLEQAASDRAAPDAPFEVSTEIEASITGLLDKMQPPFRSMLLRKLGYGQ